MTSTQKTATSESSARRHAAPAPHNDGQAARLAKARATRARRKAERYRCYVRSKLAEQPQPPLSPDEKELLAQAIDKFNDDIRTLERYEDTRKRYCRLVFDLRHPEDGHSSPITPETSPEDILLAMDATTLGRVTDLGGWLEIDKEMVELSRSITRAQSDGHDPELCWPSAMPEPMPEPEAEAQGQAQA